MIGTDGHAHTFPGATTPFGMVQLSPSNDFKGWDWCSGYHYSDSILKGFAHNHISGPGLAGLGDILLMPTTGGVQVTPGTELNPESGYRSRFSHKKEKAHAGYYSVYLDDYGVNVELTCTPRVGFHLYTFTNGGGNIIIDPTHSVFEFVINSEIEILSDTEVRGYKHSKGEAGNRKVYFHALFSKPFKTSGIAQNDSLISAKTKATGRNSKAYVSYDLAKNETVEVKLALSHVSYEGAYQNLIAEAEDLSFEEAQEQAEALWNKKLNKFHIEGSKKQKRIFYTAVYHSFISPNVFSDINGNYMVGGKQYHSDFTQYSTFSTWDTYRALHPLFTIVEHEASKDFVNSLVSRHTVSKVGLPVWELLGHDNMCMIGYNTVSPMADAVLKGIEGIDAEEVFEAIKAASVSLEKGSANYDDGMKEYLTLGFVPGEINSSVSKTTEQNYYDWLIALIAKKLGKQEDFEHYLKRSVSYRYLFHEESKFLYPRNSTGEWSLMDINKWDDLIANYVSGNMWGYSSYVPHDVSGLIKLMGGKDEFEKWLDNIYADTSSIKGSAHVDISGFIGKYGHGDEPSHHMPYLYNYIGKAWKTQEITQKILNSFYNDTPDGITNNEDLGQMSAWYIFSSLGFYPVCPGDMMYIITSPTHPKATFNLENGKKFTVIANDISEENKYIQSVRLNGNEHTQSYITHQQIMDGGELVFEMGSAANKSWATKDSDLPVSEVQVNGSVHAKNNNLVFKPYVSKKLDVFEKPFKLELHCNTNNATIYYTLDGSTPNKNSKKYEEPILIEKNVLIKARAYVEKKKPSLILEKFYHKGKNLNNKKLVAKVELKKVPNRYGEESMLFDRKTGSAKFADGTWCGWEGDNLELLISFKKTTALANISVGYFINSSKWIFPPKEIAIYVSNDNKTFEPIENNRLPVLEDEVQDGTVVRKQTELNGKSLKYLKLIVKNAGAIPNWHAGAGKKPWLFIDEIIIN